MTAPVHAAPGEPAADPRREGHAPRRRLTRRTAAVLLAACLAVAAGIPLAWSSTRPSASAGPPVASALERSTVPSGPSPAEPARATAAAEPARPAEPSEPAAPAIAVRDASPPPVREVVRPVGLSVPGLDVDAPVDPVGVAPSGAMELPEDVSRVGWYRFGSAPGDERGTVVVAGHVASAQDGPGALAPLEQLEPGDVVELGDAAGGATRYEVVSREAVVKDALPVEEIFDRGGDPRLVLITCGGPYQADLGSHRDNVVVVAVPIS